ncbi:ATP-dependent nuclease [Acinetobacter pittii]|uniref:ATP-dependent nuclease n=1 Tax=Acinetobacter pittii TaxID=48296 RepID=UPI003B428E2C
MSIQLDTVRISGFRGIANIEMTLPRVTVLLGQNNAGKTSFIKALQLALGDYSRFLSDEDFHINEQDQSQEKIIIDIRLIPIENNMKNAEFSDAWQQELGDKIQSQADGQQFVAIRTIAKPDRVKGGYIIERYHLEAWPDSTNWYNASVNNNNKLNKKFECIPFISIDAQRDIHNELKEKSSFVGRVLSSVEYNESDVAQLEQMVADINNAAIEKSDPLKQLKNHLDTLNQSFSGTGQTELTPFPKKIRDLSKRFSVHYGNSSRNSFSMEYHGMGTRSWASMLAVKAFTELLVDKHEKEFEPLFPILAAEEPEAHLHPNAQRTLFEQLKKNNTQIIISTHSPYLVGMSDLINLRGLTVRSGTSNCFQLISGLDPEDINILQREILRFRGELLFSRALILFEGVTEEQIIPAMFKAYFGKSTFSLGINCISVGGKNYPPFIKMALSFGIPVLVISDSDGTTYDELMAQNQKIKDTTPLLLSNDEYHLSFLSGDNDIEAELILGLQLKDEVIEALVKSETRGSSNINYVQAKTNELKLLNDTALIEKMRSSKASYAGFLAEIIERNPNGKPKESLVPQAIINAFEKLKVWGNVC